MYCKKHNQEYKHICYQCLDETIKDQEVELEEIKANIGEKPSKIIEILNKRKHLGGNGQEVS